MKDYPATEFGVPLVPVELLKITRIEPQQDQEDPGGILGAPSVQGGATGPGWKPVVLYKPKHFYGE